jgi:hypothetical protein
MVTDKEMVPQVYDITTRNTSRRRVARQKAGSAKRVVSYPAGMFSVFTRTGVPACSLRTLASSRTAAR